MKTEPEIFMVSLPLGMLDIGEPYRILPPHCTLFPPFQTTEMGALAGGLNKIFKNHPPLKLRTMGRSTCNEIHVSALAVELTAEILSLHQKILDLLDSMNDACVIHPELAGDGYRPLITFVKLQRLQGGDVKHIGQVTLIRVFDQTVLPTTSWSLSN